MKDPLKRLIASLGSLVLIIASLYVVVSLISPTFKEIQKLREKKYATTIVIADYEAAIKARDNIISRHKDLVALQEAFSRVLPPEKDISSLLHQLHGLAVLNNVTIDSINFQKPPIQIAKADSLIKPYGTIQATIRCVSNYENMKRYLDSLETNLRLINIKTINITEGFRQNPILLYTLVIEAYYQTQ